MTGSKVRLYRVNIEDVSGGEWHTRSLPEIVAVVEAAELIEAYDQTGGNEWWEAHAKLYAALAALRGIEETTATERERRHEEMTGTLTHMNEDSYQHGLMLGYAYADADRANRMSFASAEAELRAEARLADLPSWRAFKLGIARSYRDAVRTLRNGRWGT